MQIKYSQWYRAWTISKVSFVIILSTCPLTYFVLETDIYISVLELRQWNPKSFLISIVSFSIRIIDGYDIDIKNSLTLGTFKVIQSRMTEMKV